MYSVWRVILEIETLECPVVILLNNLMFCLLACKMCNILELSPKVVAICWFSLAVDLDQKRGRGWRGGGGGS